MAREFTSFGGRRGLRPAALALLLMPLAASAAETPAAMAAGPAADASPLAAAVLPSSRSVQVGASATVFATLINGGTTALDGCAVAPSTSVPAAFTYQTTDAATNALTGSPNTPVSLGAGAAQSFVLSFEPNAALPPTQVALSFDCTGVSAAQSFPGLNTVLLSGSTSPVPDIVALVATAGNSGTLSVAGSPDAGAFAIATVNLGSGDTITGSADTGGLAQPLGLGICQTDPSSGACLSAPAATVTVDIAAGATPTFAVFASATAAIPFDPAHNRIFVHFTDSTGAVRGATSVAVMAAGTGTVAPYQDVSLGYDEGALVQAAGLKDLTFAFVEANGLNCQAIWGGLGPVASDTTIGGYVDAIRANGGDVIFSFGGAVGYELANECTSAASLQAQYQAVVTKYRATRLDFDIEYDNADSIDNTTSIDRRNQALAALQQANPGLSIRYTLPVAVNGLEANAVYVLQSALKYGVTLAGVNIMTMDYGSPTDPSTEGANAISSANAALSELSRLGLDAKLGIIVLIGKNDTWTSTFPEQFTQTDAQQVAAYAIQNSSQIDLLSFWELSRDQPCPGGGPDENTCSSLAQTPYQFSQIFQPF
jgi:Glycosyl hydrolases family 18